MNDVVILPAFQYIIFMSHVIEKSVCRQSTKKVSKKVNLVGRRVIMSADVFGGNVNQCYHGQVICKSKYKQGDMTKNGYKVKWHTDEVDY